MIEHSGRQRQSDRQVWQRAGEPSRSKRQKHSHQVGLTAFSQIGIQIIGSGIVCQEGLVKVEAVGTMVVESKSIRQQKNRIQQ